MVFTPRCAFVLRKLVNITVPIDHEPSCDLRRWEVAGLVESAPIWLEYVTFFHIQQKHGGSYRRVLTVWVLFNSRSTVKLAEKLK